MKNGFLVLVVLGFLSFQQEGHPRRVFVSDFVECYYPNDLTTPLYIYDKIYGEIVDSLFNGNEYQWYKLAIRHSAPDHWFCIEHLIQAPSHPVTEFIKYEGSWVHSTDLRINSHELFSDDLTSFYSQPCDSSKIAFSHQGFFTMNLIEVDNRWAKVQVEENIGWLPIANQCGVPWTTCVGYVRD